MSKLGGKDNYGKNYFSNTEEVYDLVKMILKEYYSKEISDLGSDLLYNGSSTIFEIQSRLKLSFENVRNYLIIMLQNNLIQKDFVTRNEVKFDSYELNFDQILNILLFPRTLNFIEKKYGNYGRMIFEQFIGFGVLTLKQVVEQIQNEPKNGKGTDLELIKAQVVDLFIKLYEDNLILYSERAHDVVNFYNSSSNNNIEDNNNNLLGNKEELKKSSSKKNVKKTQEKTEKKGKSNKKKKNEKENSKKKNKNIKLNEDEENEEEVLNESEKSQENQEKKNFKNDAFYENNTKNNMHFYINFEQIIAEFKSEIVIDYINNNISYEAGFLAGILLKKYKISSFMLDMTTPMPIEEIAKAYKSLTLHQIGETIKNNDELFRKTGSDEISLNLKIIKKEIKTRNIQNLIISKFSSEHFRVYNLLHLVGALDSKNIMDLSMLGLKKVNYIINQLFQEGFIETNTITQNQNGNNIFFYSVDEYKTTEKIIEIDLKIIKNYKSYYNEYLNNIKNKFRDINKQNEDLMKLTYIIDQICENIIIMKYF